MVISDMLGIENVNSMEPGYGNRSQGMKVEKEGNTTRYMIGFVILLVLLIGIYYAITIL
jgi:hypothetical protein